MQVIATAGHVDHGKSTLVKALTTMEPDRWEEEKRRGLTIDLGFAWTTLPSGENVAFVDVPGHERFLGNMLAGLGPIGLGPAPVLLFVVAADEGWQAQSSDHLDAAVALGIERAVVVLSRADKADAQQRANAAAQVQRELAGTPLAQVPVVEVSAVTGEGVDKLREALDGLVGPEPDPVAAVRLWIDRSFSITGAGTVVTGTLVAGTLRPGDTLSLFQATGVREVEVRGLHSENAAIDLAQPVSRVAVNLRGIDAGTIHRGDVLTTPGKWEAARVIDVRRTTGRNLDVIPQEVVAHLGSAGVGVHVRPFDAQHARLQLPEPLPVVVGDRLILRGPGARHVLAGVEVIDVAPPELNRRGEGTRRGQVLAGITDASDAGEQVRRRKAVRVEDLARQGLETENRPAGVVAFRGWWISARAVTEWKTELLGELEAYFADNPLAAGMPRVAAIHLLALPGEELVDVVIAAAKVSSSGGLLSLPGRQADLGAAEEGIAKLEKRLADAPCAAPEAGDLSAWGLGQTELAAAERAGRVVRLDGGVVLVPASLEWAKARLGEMEQPFTTSQARQALGTTRRVVIPVLEHFDAQRITRRIDAGHRELR